MRERLTLLEAILLLFIGAIVADQLIALHGHFDPSAVAILTLLIGAIPANRVDRKRRRSSEAEEEAEEEARIEHTMVEESTSEARRQLSEYLHRRDQPPGDT